MPRIAYITFAAAAFIAVSHMSYDDEQKQFNHTCSMIAEGTWPASVEPACLASR